MQVGEVRIIWDVNPYKAAIAAHNTGRYRGWRFKTATVRDGDRIGVAVKRKKDAADVAPRMSTTTVRHADGSSWYTPRTLFGFENLAPGEEVTLEGQTPDWYARAIGAASSRSNIGRGKSKYSCSTKVSKETGQYECLTVRRTK